MPFYLSYHIGQPDWTMFSLIIETKHLWSSKKGLCRSTEILELQTESISYCSISRRLTAKHLIFPTCPSFPV